MCTLGALEGSSKWSSESGLGPSHCVQSTRRVLLLLLLLALPRASLYSAESCSTSTPQTTTPSTATWPTPPPPPSSQRTSKPGSTGPRRFRAPKASGSATPRSAPSLSTSQTSSQSDAPPHLSLCAGFGHHFPLTRSDPVHRTSVDGYIQPALRSAVSTDTYNSLMSGNRAYGPKKDSYGRKLKLFSTALVDRGTLNAALSHLIKSKAWGPDGPKQLSDLYHQGPHPTSTTRAGRARRTFPRCGLASS